MVVVFVVLCDRLPMIERGDSAAMMGAAALEVKSGGHGVQDAAARYRRLQLV